MPLTTEDLISIIEKTINNKLNEMNSISDKFQNLDYAEQSNVSQLVYDVGEALCRLFDNLKMYDILDEFDEKGLRKLINDYKKLKVNKEHNHMKYDMW